jgi:hypothetical protein
VLRRPFPLNLATAAQSGLSTKPQAFHAETERQYRKRVAFHWQEWVTFCALSLIPVGIPGLLWHTTEVSAKET